MPHPSIPRTEKYDRQGWPALKRPDLKPPAGWSLPLITGVNRVRSHRLSPDGASIAFIWDREGLSDLYVMPAAGGWPQRLSFDRSLVAYWEDGTPQWHPDSTHIAFTAHGHVHLAARTGGLPEKITSFTESAFSPVWMPDGEGLLFGVDRGDHIELLLTDRAGSWPRALVTDPTGDVWDPQPSPDGRSVAYVWRPFGDLQRLDLCIVDVQTGQSHTLAGTPQIRAWSPCWSPDGEWLAYLTEQPDFNEIWLVRPDGSHRRQLTNLGADCGNLAWSPDGRWIACTVNRGGAHDLALVSPKSGEVTNLKTGQGVFSRPNWFPNSEALTVEYESPALPPDLYRVDLDGRMVQLTFSNPPALTANRLVAPEIVSYRSFDGLEIPAFLYRPEKPNGAGVVYPHGGPSSQYGFDWDIFGQYFVAKGYTWLAPNYRGSTGYGFEFEHANYGDWGHGDTQDCLHAADFLAGLPGVDRSRLAIFGPSYGGYMTACCLSFDPQHRFACGVSKYGDANLASSWAQCNRDLRLYTEIFLGHPTDSREAYRKGSPVFSVENVRSPVLVLHGLDDDVVPPEASEEWVEALKTAGKSYEYKTYAGEPHGFLQRKTQLDAYERIETFLDWHLMAGGGKEHAG